MGAAREGCFAPRSQVPGLRTDCRSRVKNPKVIYKYLRPEVASPTMIQLWARCTFCDFYSVCVYFARGPRGNVSCRKQKSRWVASPTHKTHFRGDEMSDKHPQNFRLSSLTQNRFQQPVRLSLFPHSTSNTKSSKICSSTSRKQKILWLLTQ